MDDFNNDFNAMDYKGIPTFSMVTQPSVNETTGTEWYDSSSNLSLPYSIEYSIAIKKIIITLANKKFEFDISWEGHKIRHDLIWWAFTGNDVTDETVIFGLTPDGIYDNDRHTTILELKTRLIFDDIAVTDSLDRYTIIRNKLAEEGRTSDQKVFVVYPERVNSNFKVQLTNVFFMLVNTFFQISEDLTKNKFSSILNQKSVNEVLFEKYSELKDGRDLIGMITEELEEAWRKDAEDITKDTYVQESVKLFKKHFRSPKFIPSIRHVYEKEMKKNAEYGFTQNSGRIVHFPFMEYGTDKQLDVSFTTDSDRFLKGIWQSSLKIDGIAPESTSSLQDSEAYARRIRSLTFEHKLDPTAALYFAKLGIKAKAMKNHPSIIDHQYEKSKFINPEFNTDYIDEIMGMTEYMMEENDFSNWKYTDFDDFLTQLEKDTGNKSDIHKFRKMAMIRVCETIGIIIQEMIAISKTPTKGNMWIKRKIEGTGIYMIIRNTKLNDNHQFYSLAFPKNDFNDKAYEKFCLGAKTPFGKPSLISSTHYIYKFSSIDSAKKVHFQSFMEKVTANIFMNLSIGNKNVVGHNFRFPDYMNKITICSFLVMSNGSEQMAKQLANSRFAIMKYLISGQENKSNDISEKLDYRIREPMALWLMNKFLAISEREIRAVVTEHEIINFKSFYVDSVITDPDYIFQEMYIGYQHQKEQTVFQHQLNKTVEKVVQVEILMPRGKISDVLNNLNNLGDKRKESVLGFPREGPLEILEFSNRYQAAMACNVRDWLDRSGGFVNRVSAGIDSILKTDIMSLARMKSSGLDIFEFLNGLKKEKKFQNKTEEEIWRSISDNSGRTKYNFNLIKYVLEGTIKFFPLDKLETILGKTYNPQTGITMHHIFMFKKEQITGMREIFIMHIYPMICIQFVEKLMKFLSEKIPIEMLTKGKEKHKIPIIHKEKVLHVSRQIGNDCVEETMSTSADCQAWCQGFTPMNLYNFLFHLFKDFPSLQKLLKFIFNMHAEKIILLPPGIVKSLYKGLDDPTKRSMTSKALNHLGDMIKDKRDKGHIEGYENPLLGKNNFFFKNMSNFCQGVFHFTSSFQNGANNMMFQTVNYQYFIDAIKQNILPKGSKIVQTAQVSSDDIGVLLTIICPIEAKEEIKSFRIIMGNFLAKVSSGLDTSLSLMSAALSWPKTVFSLLPLYEFNSEFSYYNDIFRILIKHTYAIFNSPVTSSLRDSMNQSSNIAKNLFERGMHTSFISEILILTALQHYKIMGLGHTRDFTKYKNVLLETKMSALGYYHLPPAIFSGIFSYDFAEFYVYQSDSKMRNYYNCMYSSSNFSISEDGIPEIHISYMPGKFNQAKKRIRDVTDKINWEANFIKNPLLYLEGARNEEEGIAKICDSMVNSTNATAEFGNRKIIMRFQAFPYILRSEIFSYKEGPRVSLMGIGKDFLRSITTEENHSRTLFSAFETYMNVYQTYSAVTVLESMTEMPRRQRHYYVSLKLRNNVTSSSISLRNVLVKYWNNYKMDRNDEYALTIFKQKFLWIKKTAQESCDSEESPFKGRMRSMMMFINNFTNSKIKIVCRAPVQKNSNPMDIIIQLMLKMYKPNTRIVFLNKDSEERENLRTIMYDSKASEEMTKYYNKCLRICSQEYEQFSVLDHHVDQTISTYIPIDDMTMNQAYSRFDSQLVYFNLACRLHKLSKVKIYTEENGSREEIKKISSELFRVASDLKEVRDLKYVSFPRQQSTNINGDYVGYITCNVKFMGSNYLLDVDGSVARRLWIQTDELNFVPEVARSLFSYLSRKKFKFQKKKTIFSEKQLDWEERTFQKVPEFYISSTGIYKYSDAKLMNDNTRMLPIKKGGVISEHSVNSYFLGVDPLTNAMSLFEERGGYYKKKNQKVFNKILRFGNLSTLDFKNMGTTKRLEIESKKIVFHFFDDWNNGLKWEETMSIKLIKWYNKNLEKRELTMRRSMETMKLTVKEFEAIEFTKNQIPEMCKRIKFYVLKKMLYSGIIKFKGIIDVFNSTYESFKKKDTMVVLKQEEGMASYESVSFINDLMMETKEMMTDEKAYLQKFGEMKELDDKMNNNEMDLETKDYSKFDIRNASISINPCASHPLFQDYVERITNLLGSCKIIAEGEFPKLEIQFLGRKDREEDDEDLKDFIKFFDVVDNRTSFKRKPLTKKEIKIVDLDEDATESKEMEKGKEEEEDINRENKINVFNPFENIENDLEYSTSDEEDIQRLDNGGLQDEEDN